LLKYGKPRKRAVRRVVEAVGRMTPEGFFVRETMDPPELGSYPLADREQVKAASRRLTERNGTQAKRRGVKK